MSALPVAQLVRALVAVRDAVAGQRAALNRLDAAIGDGDHGTGLSAGLQAAVTRLEALERPTPAEALKACALALMNEMGGSSGALYGTLFLKASQAAAEAEALSTQDLARMWRAGLEGVQQRGKAQPGDKTMVDALAPAAEALAQAAARGLAPPEALARAAQAAREGAERTAVLSARHGRAKFTGDRSQGHVDPGAASVALMFEAMAQSLAEG